MKPLGEGRSFKAKHSFEVPTAWYQKYIILIGDQSFNTEYFKTMQLTLLLILWLHQALVLFEV